jgi:PilZ domain-containing protein
MLTPTVTVVDEAIIPQMFQDMPVPAPPVAICSALLVSKDATAIKPISESMHQLAISTEVCSEASIAPFLLNRRKFGATIVDLRLGEQARAFLKKVRLSPSNRTSVMFAISDNDAATTAAFKNGSDFVITTPITMSSIDQHLRTAYNLILQEHRRYFRCPVDVPVTLFCSAMTEVRAHVVNISEGGIAIITTALVKPGIEARVKLTLPGHESSFAAESTVCWCREGQMGLQFISLSEDTRAKLNEWLSRSLEKSLPESIACKFRALIHS